MQFIHSTQAIDFNLFDTVVLPLDSTLELTPVLQQADTILNGAIQAAISSKDLDGQLKNSLTLITRQQHPQRILILGTGDSSKLNAAKYRDLVKQLGKMLGASPAKQIGNQLCLSKSEHLSEQDQVRLMLETYQTCNYRFDTLKTQDNKNMDASATQIMHLIAPASQQQFTRSQATAEGMDWCRDLGNMPSNQCTPSYLAEQALNLAKEHNHISVDILDEEHMQELGMHCFLSVGKGSVEPSKLIVLNYQGAEAKQAPHVLVGKGITFDTGGISIKPAAAMDEMKYDMCGAASVLGTIKAVASLALPINLVVIVAAAENMPSGNASKPGDIVTTMSGKTVEILNTDAEGRLVLCDALTYAERFNPATVVDVATLTGACIIALGHHINGLMSNDDRFAKQLIESSRAAFDPAWQLPLGDEYQAQLKSNFADLANIGGRSAGTITAGCFLSRFTEAYTWAHLDIAGTAWSSGAAKGATGRCVPLLVQHLIDQTNA